MAFTLSQLPRELLLLRITETILARVPHEALIEALLPIREGIQATDEVWGVESAHLAPWVERLADNIPLLLALDSVCGDGDALYDFRLCASGTSVALVVGELNLPWDTLPRELEMFVKFVPFDSSRSAVE